MYFDKTWSYNYIAGTTTRADPGDAWTTWVVSANTRHVTCFGFKIDLLLLRLTPSPHQKTDLNDLYVIMTRFRFVARVDNDRHLGVISSPKLFNF